MLPPLAWMLAASLCEVHLLVVFHVAAFDCEHLDDGNEALHNILGGEDTVMFNFRDKVGQTYHNLEFYF